ncbi:amino acid-binding protein [Acidithiobacillus sp.]|uniref:amino acid-binding protein n=1 Tax=Acidithiobacillus sp. TaxID=1872118 RepID=UPI0025B8C7DB|nr:amino acid-binding protein [Acidithiobacillus sp.]MCK9188477.1 amino acid-binding protein [Acidithiobacillus sp.]MCK9358898.1 amino acid-binding protein [Acidithiobacillus sp.]
MEPLDADMLPEQVITLTVQDEPGTLFLVSSVFSNRGISMRSLHLHEEHIILQERPCSRLTIRFLGEESRKKIICRLLCRLDCVIGSQ